jgi:hypothetical protein
MTAGAHLVGFDVDAIKDYVFGAVRPLDIAGASRIIEDFTVEAGRGDGAIYAGGGNGLLRVMSEQAAADRCRELEARFADRSGGGGSCTAAYVPEGGDLSAARRRLQYRLGRRKAERQLDTPPQELVPAATQVCQACGQEPGDIAAQREDADERWIGRWCQRRREVARQSRRVRGQPAPAWTIEELSTAAEERRSTIAAVYLDADGAGRRLLELDGGRLARFARDVQQLTRQALDDAIGKLGLEGHYLAPVVGGDDVLVLLDSQHALAMLGELWDGLGPLQTRWGLSFSGGVAFGPARIPLRLLVDQAEDALRLAKRHPPSADGDAGPAVAVTTLLGGRLHHPGRPLFGGPVPQAAWPQVGALTDALGRVAPAQQAGMAIDLTQPSEQLIELDLAYRAAADRNEGRVVAEAVSQARGLAERLQPSLPEARLPVVLLGGLVTAEFQR